jgi:hypothetical protein
MTTLPDPFDAGLEELEEAVNRGEPWKYPTKPDEEWDPAMPNPLVLRVTGLSTGSVRGEELTFLNGVDVRGKKWSRLIGSKSLRDVLLDGVISEWDDERQAYVEIARVGPVAPGERVVLTFRGFTTIKSGEHKGKEIPNVRPQRPDAVAASAKRQPKGEPYPDNGIPF